MRAGNAPAGQLTGRVPGAGGVWGKPSVQVVRTNKGGSPPLTYVMLACAQSRAPSCSRRDAASRQKQSGNAASATPERALVSVLRLSPRIDRSAVSNVIAVREATA